MNADLVWFEKQCEVMKKHRWQRIEREGYKKDLNILRDQSFFFSLW